MDAQQLQALSHANNPPTECGKITGQYTNEDTALADAAMNTYTMAWWGHELHRELSEKNIEALEFVKYIHRKKFKSRG